MPPIGKKSQKREIPTPTVRLVAPNVEGDYQGSLALQKPPITPSIRLATGVGPPEAFAKGMKAPSVKFALGGTHTQDKQMAMSDPTKLPALLVSYYYLPQFEENRKRYHFRDWVMDSGAFSAHNSGVTIDLDAYIDKCLELMATDPQLTEIYSLDVIGDWKASLKNTERMWAKGVPAIPCYHYNEPEHVLKGLAKDYPKIALGGVAALKEGGSGAKLKWASQCFSRVWPKKIHGFAFGTEAAILGCPFHSTDATNWEIGPCRFGRWASFGNAQISVRGSHQNLRAEVEFYLDLEARARVKWKEKMALLDSLEEPKGPSVRLAYATVGRHDAVAAALSKGPTVRLAEGGEGNSPGSNGATKKAQAFKPR